MHDQESEILSCAKISSDSQRSLGAQALVLVCLVMFAQQSPLPAMLALSAMAALLLPFIAVELRVVLGGAERLVLRGGAVELERAGTVRRSLAVAGLASVRHSRFRKRTVFVLADGARVAVPYPFAQRAQFYERLAALRPDLALPKD